MSRIPLVCLFVAVACAARAGAGEADRAVKILARGPWPHLPTHTGAADRAVHEWALRSADELAKVAGQGALITMPKALQVGRIDFAKQMLLVVEDGTMPLVGVSGGPPPSAPYSVAITRIERDDAAKRLTVWWRRVPRAKGEGVLTRPLQAVLIDRFDGAVTFRRLPPADQPGAADPKPAGTEVVARARANWPDGWPPEAPRKEWVVRSAAELIDPRLRAPEPVLERMREEAAARYAKALGVGAVDFGRQMIVGVSAGVQPAGTRVEVTRVTVDGPGKTMTVHWRVVPPAAGPPPSGISHPAAVALVEHFAGAVRFVQDEAKPE